MKQEHPEKRVNLHTHTAHCRHASGLPEDYCTAAMELNFDIIGFSDHAPYPDERYHSSRMFFKELKEYHQEIMAAAKNFPQLKVLSGLEVEYCADLGREYYSDYLLGELGLDYLIGAAHFTKMPDGTIHPFYSESWGKPEVIRAFVRQTIATMEHLPIAFLAHPDGFACMVERMTPELKNDFRETIRFEEYEKAQEGEDPRLILREKTAELPKAFRGGDAVLYRMENGKTAVGFFLDIPTFDSGDRQYDSWHALYLWAGELPGAVSQGTHDVLL